MARAIPPTIFLTACPQCGGPVNFTLLPPPNAAPEPMALTIRGEDAPAERIRDNRLTWYLAGSAAALIAIVGLWLLITGNLG